MPQLSEYEEMYLKRIFEIYDIEPSTILKTSELAKIMGVSNASSTEMMQRLSSRNLLTYVPYKGCRLTPEGFKHAARVKRRTATSASRALRDRPTTWLASPANSGEWWIAKDSRPSFTHGAPIPPRFQRRGQICTDEREHLVRELRDSSARGVHIERGLGRLRPVP